MRDELLLYYERELTYLRQMGVEFAAKYPKVASRLVLEPDKCEDPHVERLLEAFAFLAARVHLKMDDEFPEITEALLNVVYPHFIRPVPSMSIVEFLPEMTQGKLTSGLKIGRGSVLYSRPVGGMPCKFHTCYETTLWPATVTAAEWKSPDRLQPAIRASDSVGAIRLELQCAPDVLFPALEMDELRFYLSGESQLAFKLYELLSSRVNRIIIRDPTPGSRVSPVTLSAEQLKPEGFDEEDSMLPDSGRSFIGYRLLQEFFTFPEKFLFFTLQGLAPVWESGFKDRAEIIFLFARFEGDDRRESLEAGLSARTFRLGCSPIVNLFPQTAEPILLDQKKYEYPVIADARRPLGAEVFSVDSVSAINVKNRETVQFQPLYSFGPDDKGQAYWMAKRRPSFRENDNGTEVSISLLDLSMRTVHPHADTLTIKTTCTNRDLPSKLPFGNPDGDFELEEKSPVDKIITLTKPTPPIRPPLGKSIQWHLISHLSLNYLSLVGQGRESLQQILKLYNTSGSLFSQKIIEGITRLDSRRHFARLLSEHGIAFARGTRVEIEFDESQFVGGGVYLFASVLEHFLGQYVGMNSFSQLVAKTKQRKEVLREWPPRTGRKILM
ncbi:MAG: type VI secretion system baseplate subunit TssF [Acidobacteriia bacterium]|nr:type VI secretion system baseplate subunit TssF [Terriglobia bacterium]